MRTSKVIDIGQYGNLDWESLLKNARALAAYRSAGFTAAQAKPWVGWCWWAPTPKTAWDLEQAGRTAYDFYLIRSHFFAPKQTRVDLRTEEGSAEFVAWMRSPIPGVAVCLYQDAGIGLDEALRDWEQVRVDEPVRWEESLLLLGGLQPRRR